MSEVLQPVRPPSAAGAALRARIGSDGARRWYGGAVFALVYQAIELAAVWTGPASVGAKVVDTACLSVLYLLFVLVPPLVWPESERTRVLVTLGLGAVAVLLLWPVGLTAMWTWILVIVVAAFSWSSQLAAMLLVAAVVAVTALICIAAGWPSSVAAVPWVSGSVGVLMVGFGQQIRQTAQLKAANERIAQLAVAEERARFARDLHDSLGHSLTVAAVKAELAGRLLDRDPPAARAEIAAVEALARNALADLRASVSGFRGVTLEGELASAAQTLEGAGVRLTVEGAADAVRPALRPVFAWAVREAVTNLLRHSDATSCTIELRRGGLRVRNDRARPSAGEGGSGLRGIAERAATVGARIDTRRTADGGFELRVER